MNTYIEITWQSGIFILYLLIGFFIALVQEIKIDDDGKRILVTWATILLWPRTIILKRFRK
jgi:hypothetical protein